MQLRLLHSFLIVVTSTTLSQNACSIRKLLYFYELLPVTLLYLILSDSGPASARPDDVDTRTLIQS